MRDVLNNRKLYQAGCLVGLFMAGLLAVPGLWIQSKAHLAQWMLRQAWQQSLQMQQAVKPWPWADVSTAARLQVPALSIDQIVLNSGSGEAMAFGPALFHGSTDDPGSSALTVIGGHRDTHLSFLQHAHQQLPLRIRLQGLNGQWHDYDIVEQRIADTRRHRLSIPEGTGDLVLITCYPFSAHAVGGPLRLLAMAQPVPD